MTHAVRTGTSLIWLAIAMGTGIIISSGKSAAEENAPGPYLTVTGHVHDANGNPVADAIVSVVYDQSSSGVPVANHQTSDQDGRYRCELTSGPRRDVAVVAWKAGYGLGLAKQEDTARFGGPRRPVGSLIELPVALTKPRRLTLFFVDADREPVRGGQLGISSFAFPMGASVSKGARSMLDHLTRKIDADGRVTLDYLSQTDSAVLLVETAEQGVQLLRVGHETTADGATVELLPVGTVNVTLTADDASTVQGREVLLSSWPQKPAVSPLKPPLAKTSPYHGVATVETNKSGKATAIMVAGTTGLTVRNPRDARVFPNAVERAVLEPGGVLDVTVKLEPGVKLRGRVLTQDDHAVAGVEISTRSRSNGPPLLSASDGSFETWVPAAGRVFASVVSVPPGFVRPFDSQVPVPSQKDEAGNEVRRTGDSELPTIRLQKAVLVSGTVVDESGAPLPGVDVNAAWVQEHEVHSYFTLKTDVAQTDQEGRFALQHVLPKVDVRLTAQTNGAATMTATTIHTSEDQTAKLQVTPDGMTTIAGQVKNAEGQVIPNPSVKIVRAHLAPDGHNYGTRPLEWNGSRTFTGNAHGHFQSPGSVPRFGKYSITIAAPGYLATETAFLAPPESGKTFTIADTTLVKARTAEGIVRDSSGNPVADALVWAHAAPQDGGRDNTQRVRVQTDTNGHFTLSQLHPRVAIAIVEKEGYRISGGPLMKDQPQQSMTLFRTDESIPPEHRIHPIFDETRRHAAAQTLCAAILPQRRNSSYFHDQIIEMLARMDRDAVLQEVADSGSADTRAKALAKVGEIPDAMAELEDVADGYHRAFTRFAILEDIQDPDVARDLLAAALVDAGLVRSPDHRMVVIAQVANHFAKLGDTKEAERILRDNLSQAQALSTKEWAGFARASFAEPLSRFDPETALKMVSEAEADDQTRHYQNIAHTLAAVKPDVAESVLGRITNNRYVDSPVVRVAHGMGPVDLPRALRLLEQIDQQQKPTAKARGLAVVAYAIRGADPPKAKKLLQDAFAAIPDQSGGGGSRTDGILAAAVTLLRYAEEIDPENLTDYYWRALKSYPGPNGGAWTPEEAEEEDAERQSQLALVVSLYSHAPDLPAQIMEPVFTYWDGRIGEETGGFRDRRATFMAMAMTDPPRAADWALRFDGKLDKERRRHIPQPWEVIGDTLTQDRVELGKAITRDVFHYWVIGEYDL